MDTLDPKPGYTTTEFWVTLLTVVISAVVAFATLFGHVLPKDNLVALVPTLAPVAAGIASAIYAISRSKTKQAHLQALTALNTPTPAVVSHGTVNVTPVVNSDDTVGGGV